MTELSIPFAEKTPNILPPIASVFVIVNARSKPLWGYRPVGVAVLRAVSATPWRGASGILWERAPSSALGIRRD